LGERTLAVRSVVRTEHRIEAAGGDETRLQVSRRNAPSVGRIVTCHASSSVGAEILEEGIVQPGQVPQGAEVAAIVGNIDGMRRLPGGSDSGARRNDEAHDDRAGAHGDRRG
jgi:hypothetical protein